MATTPKEQKRTIEEAVAYAVGHRIRIDALSIFNERAASPNEIANLTGEGVSKVGHHIKKLHDAGCIEHVKNEPRRGSVEHFYRAVMRPEISREEARELPAETWREISALILQAIMAEGLASLMADKMDDDDDLFLGWRILNLDAQGRRELADEQVESLRRVVEIEARSEARLVDSGETCKSAVFATMGFERGRQGRPSGDLTPTRDA